MAERRDPSTNCSAGLAELDAAGLRRRRPSSPRPAGPRPASLTGRAVVAFCSNDYLGLAAEPALAEAAAAARARGVGSGASHLVSGHTAAHEALKPASPPSSAWTTRCISRPATWPTSA